MKYKGMTCLHETCDGPARVRYRCFVHDWQFKTYGYTWDSHGSGTQRPPNPKYDNTTMEEFERRCDRCGEVKYWTKFVVQASTLKPPLCHTCYRDELLAYRPVQDTGNWDDAMAYIDKKAGRNKTRTA